MHRIGCIKHALLACALTGASVAHAGEAHVHGHGKLDVALDGGTLSLRLESPLDSFVGFERAPKNAKERGAVQRMTQPLRADNAFTPSPAARCRLQEMTLSSPVLDPALLAPAAASGAQPPAAAGQGAAARGRKGHAALVGEYVYACADPAALRGIEVGLFESFKGLQRLDVQVIGPARADRREAHPQIARDRLVTASERASHGGGRRIRRSATPPETCILWA